MTAGRFTAEARRFADGTEIVLIDGDELSSAVRVQASAHSAARGGQGWSGAVPELLDYERGVRTRSLQNITLSRRNLRDAFDLVCAPLLA